MTAAQVAALNRCISVGGVALFPSDTVYGLATEPHSEDGVRRLYALKARPPERAAAVMFFDLGLALEALPELGPRTRTALERLLPGAVTVLLPNPARRFPLACAGEPERLGVRVPALTGELAPLAAVRRPVLQSSANRSGGPDARRLIDVDSGIRAGVDLQLDGGVLQGTPSTVLDLSSYEDGGAATVLREGAAPAAALIASLPVRPEGKPMTSVADTQADRPAGGQEAGAPIDLSALEPIALAATRAAALACQPWVGRGDGKAADGAATDAMRRVLDAAPGRGTVVVGEGAKDEAPMLFDGEVLGRGDDPEFDIAVDPLECTTLCAKGMPDALATISIGPPGSLAALGQSFYMDKLVAPGAAAEVIDITREPEENLERVASALSKEIEAMVVVVLDKPRHGELVQRLHAAGARVITPAEGDVGGALSVLLGGGEADLLMGVGGTPEGVMTACTARAAGGCMQARLAPQSDDEASALAGAGLDTERVYGLADLAGAGSFFVATGVSGGSLLRRPWGAPDRMFTESMVMADGSLRYVVEAQTPGSDPRGGRGDTETDREKE